MASRLHCRDCLRYASHEWKRARQLQARHTSQSAPNPSFYPSIRALSTTSFRSSTASPPPSEPPQTSSPSQHLPPQPLALKETVSPLPKPSLEHRAARYLTSKITNPMSRTASYIAYNQTALLFAACSAPGSYTLPVQSSTLLPADRAPDIGVGTGFWYEALHLQPTFNTWAQISFLHMWLVMTRLRGIGEKEGGPEVVRRYAQLLVDHFSHAAEDRMGEVHGIVSKSVRARYVKDLFTQWRGLVAAYDEGLVRGDAALGAAVWRNLWGGVGMRGGEGTPVDWRGVAVVVGFMRRVVQQLSEIESQDMVLAVVQKGEIFKFNDDEKSWLTSNR